MDNAEPSTNGIAAQNLDRLALLLDDSSYETRARQTCDAFEAEIMQHPFLFASLLDSVVVGKLGLKSVALTGEGERVETWLQAWREKAGGVVSKAGGSAKSEWLRGRNKLVGSLDVTKERVMVCEGGRCTEELGTGMGEVEKALNEVR
jgi:uncharacterized protein YyaL (SSP411 family)